MERVGDTLLRMRLKEFQRKVPPDPGPEPEPTCPICHDHGYVRHDVPLGHPDFGRAFPCACQGDELRERLRRRSNLGPLSNRTFDTFNRDGRDQLSEPARQRVRAAAEECEAYASAPDGWLILDGPSACGKTHLAAAIANRQIEMGNEVFFTVVPDLLDHLRATYGPNSDVTYDELFESVRNSPFLVLDDLGTQSSSSWAQEKLFQILNYRYNAALPTVITTNHQPSELDARLRARLTDTKISHTVHVRLWDSPILDALLSAWPEGLKRQRFDNFEIAGQGLAPKQCESLDRAHGASWEFCVNPTKWLVLVGEVGVGKTHLAAAIKNERDAQQLPTVFMTVPDLLDYLRAAYAPSSEVTYDQGFDAIRNAPVLILDDYGAHSATLWAEEKLFQLLNHRFNARLPTVITTNVPFDQPELLAPAHQQDRRIYSRLLDRDLATVVRIDAPRFKGRELPTHRRSEPAGRPSRPSNGKGR